MEEDATILISVFSSHNAALFQLAKTLLNEQKIKFWSNGEFMNANLSGSPYTFEIKVHSNAEKTAKKLLNKLIISGQYEPTNEFDKKTKSFVGHWAIVIAGPVVIIMILIFLLLK